MAAIVGNGSDGRCQTVVISGHGSGIAQGAKVLAWIERVSGCVAQGTGVRVAEAASVGLGVVFYQQQPVSAAYCCYLRGVGTSAIEVHDEHCAGAGSDGLLYQVGVDVVGGYVGLYQDRLEPVFCHGEYRGDIGVGRHDYLVAFGQSSQLDIGAQYQRERIQPVAAAYAVARADILGIVVLKLPRGIALQVASAIDHAGHRLRDFVGMHRRHPFQVQVFYHNSHS